MKLKQYVSDVLQSGQHSSGFPESLELSTDMIQKFNTLYERGERESREFGCNVIYNKFWAEPFKEPPFKFGMIYEGDENSTNIQTLVFYENVANVNCHPTASIGDPDGYSAHSMPDFLSFEEHIQKGKPLFISFVVSGKYIYAVVYRKGLTIFDKIALSLMQAEVEQQNKEYFDTKCPVGVEDRIEKQNEILDESQRALYVRGLKAKTPNWGECLMKTAFDSCTSVATKFKYGFYSGKSDEGKSLYRRA